MAVLGLCCCAGFSLIVATLWLRCAAFSLGGFPCCRAWALDHEGSVVAAHGVSCFKTCVIIVPQPGIEPHWKVDS